MSIQDLHQNLFSIETKRRLLTDTHSKVEEIDLPDLPDDVSFVNECANLNQVQNNIRDEIKSFLDTIKVRQAALIQLLDTETVSVENLTERLNQRISDLQANVSDDENEESYVNVVAACNTELKSYSDSIASLSSTIGHPEDSDEASLWSTITKHHSVTDQEVGGLIGRLNDGGEYRNVFVENLKVNVTGQPVEVEGVIQQVVNESRTKKLSEINQQLQAFGNSVTSLGNSSRTLSLPNLDDFSEFVSGLEGHISNLSDSASFKADLTTLYDHLSNLQNWFDESGPDNIKLLVDSSIDEIAIGPQMVKKMVDALHRLIND